MTNRGPWPKHEDKGGYTTVTVKGVRYRVADTDHTYAALLKIIKSGDATALEAPE